MPPFAIYDGLSLWGFVVLAHGALLAFLDGRDHADLPFAWMTQLVQPRERRWSLLVIDVVLWILFTVAIASRVIPEATIFRYVAPLSLAWLAHTAFGILHVLLVIYAEVGDHTPDKPKRDASLDEPSLLLAEDGELIDFADIAARSRKQD
jgi:hypothetical protein